MATYLDRYKQCLERMQSEGLSELTIKASELGDIEFTDRTKTMNILYNTNLGESYAQTNVLYEPAAHIEVKFLSFEVDGNKIYRAHIVIDREASTAWKNIFLILARWDIFIMDKSQIKIKLYGIALKGYMTFLKEIMTTEDYLYLQVVPNDTQLIPISNIEAELSRLGLNP